MELSKMNWPKTFNANALVLSILVSWPLQTHGKDGVAATFKIERSQISTCERSRRFNEFMFLAATLSDQITQISITYNPQFETCKERITQSLRRINLQVDSSPKVDQEVAIIISVNIGGDLPAVAKSDPETLPIEIQKPAEITSEKAETANMQSTQADAPQISLPIIIKLAAGYTLLTPLPDEQVRDRPTIEATIRTQPMFVDYFFMGGTSLSLKSGSKLPWAAIANGMIAKDLFYLKDNVSIPLGFGLRGFKAQVNKQESGTSSSTKENIVIPEQVLGPIGQIGISYRSGLFSSEAHLAVTPIMAAGSPLITTFNASLALGYQLTPSDTVVINSLRHDVRYPTIDGFVKVILASISIGFQRDLL